MIRFRQCLLAAGAAASGYGDAVCVSAGHTPDEEVAGPESDGLVRSEPSVYVLLSAGGQTCALLAEPAEQPDRSLDVGLDGDDLAVVERTPGGSPPQAAHVEPDREVSQVASLLDDFDLLKGLLEPLLETGEELVSLRKHAVGDQGSAEEAHCLRGRHVVERVVRDRAGAGGEGRQQTPRSGPAQPEQQGGGLAAGQDGDDGLQVQPHGAGGIREKTAKLAGGGALSTEPVVMEAFDDAAVDAGGERDGIVGIAALAERPAGSPAVDTADLAAGQARFLASGARLAESGPVVGADPDGTDRAAADAGFLIEAGGAVRTAR
ncbi:hypothetical protein [Streptomyces sp. NPDC000878]